MNAAEAEKGRSRIDDIRRRAERLRKLKREGLDEKNHEYERRKLLKEIEDLLKFVQES